jgi:ketosteroid isomerase-like protein
MSQDVEIVQRAFAEFERGDFWTQEIWSPHIHVVWLDALAAGTSETVGLEQLATTLKRWFESWDRVTMSAERILDAGDRVAVIAVWRGRGKASGVDTEWRHGQLWTLVDGKAVDLTTFRDPNAALEAAGLSG